VRTGEFIVIAQFGGSTVYFRIRATDQAHAKALDKLFIIVIVSDIIRPGKAGNGAPKPIRV
jgi:hypothetical protein